VLELVGLHAPGWNDAGLRAIDWLGEPDAARGAQVHALYQAMLPGFLDRYGARLARDEAAIIERLGAASSAPLFGGLPSPYSLIHVDYRLDNLLIDASAPPPRVTAVDWQSITLGSPLSDVAYFLGGGMLPEARREAESDIVRAYHAALEAAGVGHYDWAACWEDYRRGAFAGFGVTVIASMLVERTARGDEMFTVMARRHARHALDLGAQTYLG
jgi:aminoglycoside phosphotransferase (APT) family kinase protein